MQEDLTPESIVKVLDDLAAGKKAKTGPQSKRKGSEPDGPLTSLNNLVSRAPPSLPHLRRACPLEEQRNDTDSTRGHALSNPSRAAEGPEGAVPCRVEVDVSTLVWPPSLLLNCIAVRMSQLQPGDRGALRVPLFNMDEGFRRRRKTRCARKWDSGDGCACLAE